MAQEEETQKCSNSNSGGGGGINIGNLGRSSKKQKQKKVPQRGLGVAQLENIRLEEQQKKDGSIILTSPPPPPPIISSSSSQSNKSISNDHLLSIPNYNQSYSSSSSISYPCDISSPISILRPQNLDIFNSNYFGWQSISVHQGHGNISKIWNSCDYNNLEKEACGVDLGLAPRSDLNLPFESNPIWPIPCLMQRAQYHHQPPPCSMINVSSSTSSSSSLLNLHMELPSNQSCYGNYSPFWPEEGKTVGMKRPFPFALDNSPGPSFHCKFPPFVHPIGRSDESISFSNESKFNFIPINPNFREGPSCSDLISDSKPISKKSTKENGVFNGDFLTLTPPTTSLTNSNSKLNQPNSAYLASHSCESFDFDSLPYQGSMEDSVLQPAGPSVPKQLQPYYSFLPPAIMQIGQGKKTLNNCNGGEVVENIDLNLRL